jgi:UDP-4-amino-4,6-dideoxy-N-acetyl-beta-L-altrosamine transaminase
MADKLIPYGKHSIDEEDIQAVVDVLKSDWLTCGSKIEQFENILSSYNGVKHAIAVCNGTAALHLSMLTAGLAPGDEVITTPVTFLASVNSILYTGAKPVFADILIDSYTIDPEDIERKVTDKTKAILTVDLAGHPCDMRSIKSIADNYNLKIIQDSAHSLGSLYNDTSPGYYSDLAILSFHPVKHITTGEGGAILTNNSNYYGKIKSLRSHGILKESQKLTKYDGKWYYEVHELGYNYRITDIQCALGISQMKKLDFFLNKRREIVNKYNNAFSNYENIFIPVEKPGCRSAYHLYILRLDFDKIGRSRHDIVEELYNKCINTQVHYIPVNMQPYYMKKLGCNPEDTPDALEYYRTALSLPLYPSMTDDDVSFVIDNVLKTTGLSK